MKTESVLCDRAVLSEDLQAAAFPLSPVSHAAIHGLPALPAPHRHGGTYESTAFTYFTADQMYEYALAERRAREAEVSTQARVGELSDDQIDAAFALAIPEDDPMQARRMIARALLAAPTPREQQGGTLFVRTNDRNYAAMRAEPVVGPITQSEVK